MSNEDTVKDDAITTEVDVATDNVEAAASAGEAAIEEATAETETVSDEATTESQPEVPTISDVDPTPEEVKPPGKTDGELLSDKMKADRQAKRDKTDAELAKGYYLEVSLPHQPVVNVQVDPNADEEEQKAAAIKLYNRWASITSTDHQYGVNQVPKSGPRLHQVDIDEETGLGTILLD